MSKPVPRVLVFAGMGSVLLPWIIQENGIARWGLPEGDGITVLVLGFVTLVLMHFGYRFAWIAVALATVVTSRAILTLSTTEGAQAGFGLWASALLFAGAVIALIYDLFASIERPDT